MDEDFLDVTDNSKRALGVFILVILAILVAGYFLVFKKVGFSLKTVELELGNTLSENLSDYVVQDIENESEWKLDLSKVRVDEVGTYYYTVTYNKKTKKAKVKVVDTTAPEFTLKEMLIEKGNEDYYLGDFLETCEDYSKPCLVSLKNSKDEEKFKTVGEYTVDIVVADVHNNKKSAKAKLKVVEEGSYVDSRVTDLEVASNSRKEENFKGTTYLTLEKALNPESLEAEAMFDEVSVLDLNEYVSVNYEGYKLVDSEIVILYNKGGFVVGYSIELKISDGKEKTVYVDKEKVPRTEGNEE